ncbi:MAG: outer membrane protein assembly factor BamD [Verrucomicrobia bacterium]|nr:outer membrane protein assembly factor BamD [Verrucomicrobiota bacterium]
MNPPAKLLLAAALLLGAHAHAEFVRVDGAWQVKPGTPADVTPPARLPVLLLAMDHASARLEAGDVGGALKEWEIIGEANVGAEAEAIAMLTRARLFVGRGEFEKATELIDGLFARHSGFPGFAAAVELQIEIANRLAEGERRRLGGWFPWFSDRDGAVGAWEKAIRLAPNGPRADECLIRIARLGMERDLTAKTNDALERLVSDYPTSKFAPEALEMLATLRAKESLGPAWDQATTLEAADHWRTLADQFPDDPRAKVAIEQIAVLRDRAARARLSLARFYFFNRNNPEAAKLMANACRNIAPESAAAKEAETLLAAIEKDPNPPKTLADRLLGAMPRPRGVTEAKPQVVGEDLDALGFKKEGAKAPVGPDNR